MKSLEEIEELIVWMKLAWFGTDIPYDPVIKVAREMVSMSYSDVYWNEESIKALEYIVAKYGEAQ